MNDRRRSEESEVDDWIKVVDRLPFVGAVKRDLTALRELLYDRRAPRIAAVGMPGSGRTSLANALLNAAAFGPGGAAEAPAAGRWVRIDADGRRLDWLELPAELERAALLERARPAFDETVPDVLVGVVEAGTEESAAKRVHDALDALLADLGDHHEHRKPPVLVVLTKVDTLPPTDAVPPYPADKRTAVDLAIQSLRKSLADLGQPDEAFRPVCARPLDAPGAPRWNVAKVGEELLERLPEAAQVEAVRAFEVGREARRRVARAVVNSSTALAVTVGLAPVPFADAFILLPLQAAMVTGIAYLSGRPWDRKAASEWIASIGVAGGAGFGLRWGARQLAKLVPGAGSLVGAGVAGAGTLAIGRSAMGYFIDGPGSLNRRPELRADNA
ncbi:MAG TPA: hypothetical protein RMH99_32415 [Sandaracinaceae bacterium LLY-WYZ-13_1]|nr:hypothetical protein [Sandaracinaceae bacterium LLY-WYZ-13_1]